MFFSRNVKTDVTAKLRFTINARIWKTTKPDRVCFSRAFPALQEVKTLEGTLADYNLAVDKVRTTADPGEVTKYLHDLEDQNR